MTSIITILFYTLLCVYNTLETDPFGRFYNNDNLKIGYGENCYLFWSGDKGYRKNGEFRCGSAKGDPMSIKKVATDEFKIFSGNKALYWNGDSGDTKNAEFRVNKPGNKFWIRKQPDGQYAIGFKRGATDCPLYWSGDKGDTKNAEFRCGEPISDIFWIKGDGCKPTKVKILDDGADAVQDGIKIVGVTSHASCVKNSLTSQLQLTNTESVEETVGLTTSESTEINWGASVSVTVEASAKFLGSGGSVAVTAEASVGGAKTFETSKEKSTATATSSGSTYTATYLTPGGALVLGYSRRYRFDKSKVPTQVTVTCKGGYSYVYDTTVGLQTKTYSHTIYKHYVGTFLPGKCTPERAECIDNIQLTSFQSIREVREAFKACFPPVIGTVPEGKRKRKQNRES